MLDLSLYVRLTRFEHTMHITSPDIHTLFSSFIELSYRMTQYHGVDRYICRTAHGSTASNSTGVPLVLEFAKWNNVLAFPFQLTQKTYELPQSFCPSWQSVIPL